MTRLANTAGMIRDDIEASCHSHPGRGLYYWPPFSGSSHASDTDYPLVAIIGWRTTVVLPSTV